MTTHQFKVWRDRSGIPHVEATAFDQMYRGQGYVHACDRGMQLLLMRILGQGRACELLDDSDEMLAVDTFFRRMNWTGGTQQTIASLAPDHRRWLEAYCEGVNAGLQRKTPWEFRLLGYRPDPWSAHDTVMLIRMIGYLTLAQSQSEIERLLVEMVQAGVSREKLEELFPGNLQEMDYELLNRVSLGERIVPPDVLWSIAAPRMMASNNWVVAGRKSASGKPLIANDPHLETNRLPNVWCELALTCGERTIMGGSMPGIPGLPVGRSPDLAWGATYAFVDASDSWVERCRDGCYYRAQDDAWHAFRLRREIITRKKKPPVEILFYENDHGVLDGDPNQEGYYLATRWVPGESGEAMLKATFEIGQATSVTAGMAVAGPIESAWSTVLADRHGNIGFQMTGRVPRRREGLSGFVPLPGWHSENDWQGFLTPEEMPRALNPEEGFIVTANNNLNALGTADPINISMGAYRAERIRQLLQKGDDFTTDDMTAMHFDLYSLQAERFMSILKPLLPDAPQADILRGWDYNYDAASQGAYLFEQFYQALYREVFGRGGMGENVVDYLAAQTGVFVDFYANFDRILLAPESTWFNGESREDLYRRAMKRALAAPARQWGEARQIVMAHILLGGRLPGFTGFDRGPITVIGSRATIHQGQIYRSGGRMTTFMPSFRWVADMAGETLRSNLAGGPSDRRFSRWYTSDLANWQAGRYKTIAPEATQERHPFP
ncbi:MAG: penicillin acylase family protein [Desulfobacterales bacterium]|nr:penicillin acylase family protein [Desulfobacterales bacterium]